MNHLSIQDLTLREDQSITLSYHRKTGEWWAVLWAGGKRIDITEEAGAGSSPTAALAELLLAIGAGKIEGAN